MSSLALVELIGELKRYLIFQGLLGLEALPLAEPAAKRLASLKEAEDLAALEAQVRTCQRCRLAEGRTKLVFGEGRAPAEIMFIGEAPGAEEDLAGRPFVGPAGQLLTKIIQAMGLDRQEVYIANVVKCRPPKNRTPQPDEVAACLPFLEDQITLVRPKVIVALGSLAAQTLLAEKTPISRLRGRFHDRQGIPVMPTFHPSYLLRGEERPRKVLVWSDMKQVLAKLGRPLRAGG